jgi:hypothetical protein
MPTGTMMRAARRSRRRPERAMASWMPTCPWSNPEARPTHYRPLRVRKHQNGDLAASQVLLILDILVCREQYFEAGRTSGLLHKLLHRRFPEPPEMHQNGCITPILHNNIGKVGSFRNRQVVGSTPTLGSNFFPQSCQLRAKLPDRLASCRMDEPERLQLAARGLQFGKPAAFLLQQVILHPARIFGCFENVFPLSSTFAEQNRVTFRRFR